MVVSAGDPREDLENFMKIGEGSTGTVCIATYKSTGKLLFKFIFNMKPLFEKKLFICLF